MQGENNMNKKYLLGFSVLLLAFVTSAFAPITAVQTPADGVLKSDVAAMPVDPGKPDLTLVDANSSLKASEKRTLSGDTFIKDVFERPFTSISMDYLPETDILSAAIFTDATYPYFTIKLAGLSKVDFKLSATYGIEFDVNKDGRGDFLVTATNPGKDWSSVGVSVYSDPNKDVGGPTPIWVDSKLKVKGDGYETTLDNLTSAFVRIDPANEAAIQIAISRQLISDPKEFLWGAWADGSPLSLQKLDFNDMVSLKEAGSPIKGDPTYPIKAVFAMDNTCRVAYGFQTTLNIPGMCIKAAPAKPAPKNPNTKTG